MKLQYEIQIIYKGYNCCDLYIEELLHLKRPPHIPDIMGRSIIPLPLLQTGISPYLQCYGWLREMTLKHVIVAVNKPNDKFCIQPV